MARDKRTSAAFLLGVFLMGGVLCPCRGLAGAIERYLQRQASEPSHSTCACCHHEEEPKDSDQPPRSCECLSGCCDAYIPPSIDSAVNLSVTVPIGFAPMLESRLPELVVVLSPDPHRFRPPERDPQAELCSFRI